MARQDLDRVIVVLCEPQDPINIGNSARAMKNMGLTRLRLVQPVNPDPRRISISAPRAEDLIESIEIFDSLPEALADVSLTAALSGRAHRAQRRFARPRALAPDLLAEAQQGGQVALLFGREDRGLSMEQLDLAQVVVQIPTREDYGSLNLGQAVLLMCYELFCACGELPPVPASGRRSFPAATSAQLEGMFGQIEETLWAIEFFKSGVSAGIMRSLRGVFARAALDEREARMMRGLFAEVLHYARRAAAREAQRRE